MPVPRDLLMAVLPTIAEPCSQVFSLSPLSPLDVYPGAQQAWGCYIPKGCRMTAFLSDRLPADHCLGGAGLPPPLEACRLHLPTRFSRPQMITEQLAWEGEFLDYGAMILNGFLSVFFFSIS